MALERRQEQVAAQRKVLGGTFVSLQKHQEETSNRKHWEDREEGKEKQREPTLTQKDKEKEVEAIKVPHL